MDAIELNTQADILVAASYCAAASKTKKVRMALVAALVSSAVVDIVYSENTDVIGNVTRLCLGRELN